MPLQLKAHNGHHAKQLMTDYLSQKELLLKNRLQHILDSQSLETQRSLITDIAADLGVDILDCAAALLHLTQNINYAPAAAEQKPSIPVTIKMVRYRLDIGSKHQVTLEMLKKVLVEESGVDKNNIQNVSIRNLYTLIELPDAMPPDIFLHLKSVEINQQKLDIKRVKTRNKKRGNTHLRRARQSNPKPGNEVSDLVNRSAT